MQKHKTVMAYGGLGNTEQYQEFLECSLCLDTLKSPKLLPCGHSFCLEPCLRDSLSTDLKNGQYRIGELRCPMCKTMHILGEKGLNALPPDHKANTLLSMLEQGKQNQNQPQERHRLCTACDGDGESNLARIFCMTCKEAMCAQCEKHHDQVQEDCLHAVVSLIDHNIGTVLCKHHPKRYLIKFCVACIQAVCYRCVMQTHGKHTLCDFKNAQHNSNPLVSIINIANRLSTDLDQLRSHATETLGDIAGVKSAHITQSKEVIHEIDKHIDKLISELQRKRKILHSKVQNFLETEVRSVDAQENQLKSSINEVDGLYTDLNQVILPLGITNKITLDGTLPLDSIQQRILIAKKKTCQYLPTEHATYAFVPNKTKFQAGDVTKEEVAKPKASREMASSKTSLHQQPSGKIQSDPFALCLDHNDNPCEITFGGDSMDASFKQCGPNCTICGRLDGALSGTQPEGGKMTVQTQKPALPGYEGFNTIVINYDIPSGYQSAEHPNPGRRYSGTSRVAYLPDNKEGNEILKLLRRAFDDRLIFTIGHSSTAEQENRVTWNGIHHKTSVNHVKGGHGYPDPGYLHRVREQLADRGIK